MASSCNKLLPLHAEVNSVITGAERGVAGVRSIVAFLNDVKWTALHRAKCEQLNVAAISDVF